MWRLAQDSLTWDCTVYHPHVKAPSAKSHDWVTRYWHHSYKKNLVEWIPLLISIITRLPTLIRLHLTCLMANPLLQRLHPRGRWPSPAGPTGGFVTANPSRSCSGLAATQSVLDRLWRQIHLGGLSGRNQETHPHQHWSERAQSHSAGSSSWVRRRTCAFSIYDLWFVYDASTTYSFGDLLYLCNSVTTHWHLWHSKNNFPTIAPTSLLSWCDSNGSQWIFIFIFQRSAAQTQY